jgi:hypothetical protein
MLGAFLFFKLSPKIQGTIRDAKMKCPKCQFENRDGAKFCKDCGADLKAAYSKCGTAYEFGSKFCDECGFDLRKSSESLSYEYSHPDSYTPKFLADQILTSRSSIEGERKLVTVLFADLANYTAMAEKLDPEIVHQIMDGCFQILMREIHYRPTRAMALGCGPHREN